MNEKKAQTLKQYKIATEKAILLYRITKIEKKNDVMNENKKF